MIGHRPSRPFRKAPDVNEVLREEAPSVTPGLVEHLQEVFALHLAPDAIGGLDGAVNTAIAMAEQRGREEVLSYLDSLTQRPTA